MGKKMENEFDWSKLSDKERVWALLLLLFATSDQKIIEEKKKDEGKEKQNEQSRAGTIR
jgi:hypothetical protein